MDSKRLVVIAATGLLALLAVTSKAASSNQVEAINFNEPMYAILCGGPRKLDHGFR
jgi:hypothetical protein